MYVTNPATIPQFIVRKTGEEHRTNDPLFLKRECKLLRSSLLYDPPQNKINKMTVHPAKTQISLGIRPVWSVFDIRMKKPWVLSYPLRAQRRLWSDWVIWVFAGRTVILLALSWGGSDVLISANCIFAYTLILTRPSRKGCQMHL